MKAIAAWLKKNAGIFVAAGLIVSSMGLFATNVSSSVAVTNQRLDDVNQRLGGLNGTVQAMEARISEDMVQLEARISEDMVQLEARISEDITELQTSTDSRFDEVNRRIIQINGQIVQINSRLGRLEGQLASRVAESDGAQL